MSRKVETMFDCHSNDASDESGGNVQLNAVTDVEAWPEFTKYTPMGHIDLSLDAACGAVDFFEEGATYRVTFERVEE